MEATAAHTSGTSGKPSPPVILVTLLVVIVTSAGCGLRPSEPPAELRRRVIEQYADGAHTLYARSLASARELDQVVDAFVAEPTRSNLDAARQAWLKARTEYSATEVYRFYGGPIDEDYTGVEGYLNAWPLDESYIDYVVGYPNTGIINAPEEFPVINLTLLLARNGVGGEGNISTGWHAVEFLLWGQDLSADGPGNRPVSDFTTAPNADRRRDYLAVTSDLLVSHLSQLVNAWAPDAGNNYHRQFLALPDEEAIRKMLTGIGELSRGELAGERMYVAYSERTQEDETSCFSDNSLEDIIDNIRGIQMVYSGDYGGSAGAGIDELVASVDRALAHRLHEEITRSMELVREIPAPFDQHLRAELPDDAPGRQKIMDAIISLETQTDTIIEAGEAIGVPISVS